MHHIKETEIREKLGGVSERQKSEQKSGEELDGAD